MVSNSTTVRDFIPSGAALSKPASIPTVLAAVEPGVVTITTDVGAGTGMIITTGGEVVTNYHVIGGSSGIDVSLFGQTTPHQASIRGYDKGNDVAVLQIQGISGLHPVSLGDSARLVVGDSVVAVGNALDLPGGPTVTSGIVSALNRTIGGTADNGERIPPNLIQTDAAINPGNSGGPLVNTAGQVVGMNTLVLAQANAQQSATNLGFAIPVDTIKSLIPALAAGQTLQPPYLGVSPADNTPAIAKEYGISVTTGAIISDVVPGSPAASAGVQRFDVITAFGGEDIANAARLLVLLDQHQPGDAVPLTIVRGSTVLRLQVTLGTVPASRNSSGGP
jgi:S1-C subfamily serine protease